MPDARTPGVDACDRPPVPDVTHRFVDVVGAECAVAIHLAEAGDGDPVPMLHGWPEHWYCWRHVVGELSGEYRSLMPDLLNLVECFF